MKFFQTKALGVDAWENKTRRLVVLAADAESLVRIYLAREVHLSWKFYGSADQSSGLFLLAHPGVSENALKSLSRDTRLLLPSDAPGWVEMSLQDVSEIADVEVRRPARAIHLTWPGDSDAGGSERRMTISSSSGDILFDPFAVSQDVVEAFRLSIADAFEIVDQRPKVVFDFEEALFEPTVEEAPAARM